ncbi:TonB-dependent siderophore receptor [Cellvibrio japonicus]|uniref:TonB-dependent receptor protein n=1 Tax=Cellvibrio japonicus (strain Ueda107) TaxID=498211 RepID=B3PGL7_CELJU|nr:TonB-dependent siderophore receptor [Cellvibrio japonicus]ACE85857.1 TonB-dependent receptor protein [Cellvibrio japonicus Ueda107]
MSDKSISALRTKKKAKPGIDHIWPWARHSCIALAMAASMQVIAQQPINIPAQPLADALKQLGEKTGLQIIYDAAIIKGLNSQSAQGSNSQEVLRQLLGNTNIKYTISGNSVTLHAQNNAAALPSVQIISAPLGSTTEGSGSYTTGDTNSSTGLALSLRETPQSITVMSHDRLKDQGLTDVDKVMEQVVGIEPDRRSSIGGDSVGYVARGFFVSNYQVDGIPRPAAIYGFSEDKADLLAYDRLEIVRGPSGLMTGAGNPSAAINLIRKRPTDDFQANISAKTGSWDLYRLQTDVAGSLSDSGKVRGRFAVAKQENDTFVEREHIDRQIVYGVVDAMLFETTEVFAGVEYQDIKATGVSRGGVPLYFSDGSKTNLDTSTNSGTDWSAFNHDSTTVFVGLEHFFSEIWKLKLDAEHKEGTYDQKFGYAYARTINKDTGAGAMLYSTRWNGDTELNAFNANLQGAFEWFGRNHELAFNLFHAAYKSEAPAYPGWYDGGDYRATISNIFDFYNTGAWPEPDLSATGIINGGDVKTTSLSGVIRLKPSDSVSVILGSRLTDWEQTRWSKNTGAAAITSPVTKENGVITPYTGLVVDITDNWSAYASYTSIFEPQSVKDITGNTLDPLEGNNYELGLKAGYLNGRLNISAAVFQMKQENYPVIIGNQVTAPDGSRAYRAEKGVEADGFEVEIAGQLLPGWQIAGGFARAKAEDNNGKPLRSRIPENTFKVFSSYQLHGALSGFTVGGSLRWQDTTYLENTGPNGETFEQKEVFLVDTMAKYLVNDHVTLSLNINNLFDETYYGALDVGSARYGEPRNISLSISYDF